MATFLENLWSSIFTPGTTPTLLLATNATFAALQLTLFGLLVATYSYHFVALSLICGGLWWAINWFAMELARAQEMEREAEEIRRKRGVGKETAVGSDEGDVDEDSETETETEAGRATGRATGLVDSQGGPGIRVRGGPQKARAVMQSAGMDPDGAYDEPAGLETTPQPHGVQIRGGPQKILGVMRGAAEARGGREGWTGEEVSGSGLLAPEGSDRADLSSSSMTDSEWEKVSEGGREG